MDFVDFTTVIPKMTRRYLKENYRKLLQILAIVGSTLVQRLA